MTRRKPLPENSLTGPTLVRHAIAAGIPRNRLRGNDLDRRYWGVRATRPSAEDLESRCRMLLARMPPGAFISGPTAAMLHGMPVPWRDHIDSRIHIALPAPARAPHADGIRGHQYRVEDHELMRTASGILVTTPSRTWLDVAASWGLLDLVAAGDFLIHREHPLVSKSDLAEALISRRSRRGRQILHTALPLLNDRSESAPESHLRVIIQLAGLPEPSVNHVVTDVQGRFVARTDLFIAEYNLSLEYQGDYHRDRAQWRADMTRRGRVEATGKRVMELNADDLLDPVELIARIRRTAALPPLKGEFGL